MRNYKVALHNLGCKVNSYELGKIRDEVLARGWEIVPFEEEADIYIINTCTVTNIADHKTRQVINRARRNNPHAMVAALGCYVDKSQGAAVGKAGDGSAASAAGEDGVGSSNIVEVDMAVGNADKSRFMEILDEKLGISQEDLSEDKAHNADNTDAITCQNTSVTGDPDPNEYKGLNSANAADPRIRAFLKIQDGCDRFCSYCIIPYVRGRIKSREAAGIVTEARELVGKGYKEIVLTGIHISSYGRDTGEMSLSGLIRMVAEGSGTGRLRLGSLEPGIITEDFVSELSRIRAFCPHFHLSLQSGCDSVLKRMNRRYTTDEYYDKVRIIRDTFPNAGITTDIITGFPGETDEEFEETLEFVRKVRFSGVHIFKYSRREGTPAAKMPDQVPEKVKSARSSRLKALTDELTEEFRKRLSGETLDVLFEEEVLIDGIPHRTGYSREYLRVYEKVDNNQLS